MTKILSLLFLLTLSTACLKTADQVQREKRLENMTEQMKDSQGLLADVVSQMKDMQAQLDKLNGRIEELEHNQKKMNPEQLSKTAETAELIRTQQETQATQLNQIQNELKEQRAFIEKATAALSTKGSPEAPAKKKKSIKEEISAALALVKKNEYKSARTELEALSTLPDLSAGDLNKIYHGLGRVEFFTKNYEKALVYFSKVYTKYPKSTLAPSCLLYIAKSLSKLDKKDEAKEAFKRVVEDYPDSKEAAEAKKEQ